MSNRDPGKATAASGSSLLTESIHHQDLHVRRATLPRFLDDKLFHEDERYIVVTDGVLLNKSALLRDRNASSLAELVRGYLDDDVHDFFRYFRGSFSGAFYDKSSREWTAFTNHVGDKAVFWSTAGEMFAISSDVNDLLTWNRAVGRQLSVNENAVYSILTYGFMTGGETYANEITRVPPGHYLKVLGGTATVHRYHQLVRRPDELTGVAVEEIVDQLDAMFQDAVRTEFEKDVEYGYRHLVDLSGGLDSRMVTWVAHQLGYQDMLNITFSQSGYLDATIAAHIADHLGNEFLLKSLDDASFIFDDSQIVAMNHGLALYSGITGGKQLLDVLNLDHFGIEHTGQLGDVVVGSFLPRSSGTTPVRMAGAYSSRFADKLDRTHLDAYSDQEIYMFYQRGFNGALNTHLIRQHYTEVGSPFLNVELMEFCLGVPLALRANHKLYKEWIVRKHPGAASFRWEKTGAYLSEGRLGAKLRGVRKYGPPRLRKALRLPAPARATANSMNPFEFWYATKPAVREHFSRRARTVDTLPVGNEVRSDLTEMFQQGTVLEKTQALTAVAALEKYFLH
ncbi:hypothetical protein KZX45_14500 [Georgenia sp. EYE_87]|uniref:asparagine synthase-related protein n=1 Tax=Georgenia sp. EYE_87 TaxID=2853448 RepID=UPI00200346C9|nr:asparagine synthase-related protein [Georgenia sp. EYE_87]MCK6211757.1 hypothetical protein [Georgenia sp. EYE_87]